MGGQFAIINRDPLNVFESYQRVGFASKNRKPLRFAVYHKGYEASFKTYPQATTFEFDYPKVADQLPEFLGRLGVDPHNRHKGPSTLAAVSERFDFHSDILGDFKNRDSEKKENLDPLTVRNLRRCLEAVEWVGLPCYLMRRWADRIQARTILRDAMAAAARHSS
jgi:hypothetical protein